MRKLVQGGGVSLNKEKLAAFDQVITAEDLIDGKYLLVQRGKKNYYLVTMKKESSLIDTGGVSATIRQIHLFSFVTPAVDMVSPNYPELSLAQALCSPAQPEAKGGGGEFALNGVEMAKKWR